MSTVDIKPSAKSAGKFLEGVLLNAIVAVNDGDWIDVGGFGNFTVQVKGITTATVKVHGSNNPTKPANTVHDFQIGADVTADGVVTYAFPVRWIKARVSAWTSGSISAWAIGGA